MGIDKIFFNLLTCYSFPRINYRCFKLLICNICDDFVRLGFLKILGKWIMAIGRFKVLRICVFTYLKSGKHRIPAIEQMLPWDSNSIIKLINRYQLLKIYLVNFLTYSLKVVIKIYNV